MNNPKDARDDKETFLELKGGCEKEEADRENKTEEDQCINEAVTSASEVDYPTSNLFIDEDEFELQTKEYNNNSSVALLSIDINVESSSLKAATHAPTIQNNTQRYGLF
jgi:hypothetical protein